jgi:hypothetical protein
MRQKAGSGGLKNGWMNWYCQIKLAPYWVCSMGKAKSMALYSCLKALSWVIIVQSTKTLTIIAKFNNSSPSSTFLSFTAVIQRLFQLLMLVAVATIMGHNSLPHHHHTGKPPAAHHHDHHDHHENSGHHHHHEHNEDHNIFSFAQLDDEFRPSQFSKVNIDLPFLYLLTPVLTFHLHQVKTKTKTNFGYYREFPPPNFITSHLFSRPPPFTAFV